MTPHNKPGTFRLARLAVLVLIPLLLAGTAAAESVPQDGAHDEAEEVAEDIDDALEPIDEKWTELMNYLAEHTPLGNDDVPDFPDVSDVFPDNGDDRSPAQPDDSSAVRILSAGDDVQRSEATYGTRDTQASASTPVAETSASLHTPLAYAVTLLAGIGLAAGPVSLYRRVKKSQALDNDVRHSVYKFIENNPGATVTEIAEGVGVSHSTATYHIKILTEFDLIKKRRDGNSLHIFPSDAALEDEEAVLLSYMRDRETREIIRSVYANPWTYPSELARSLDMSRSSAQWHLEKLEDSGIVNVARDGKFSYLYIDPEMKDTVENHLVQ